jgi:hypothetical protein
MAGVPLAMALPVLWRRVPDFPLSVCLCGFSIVFFLLFRSFQWLGRREINVLGSHVVIGGGGPTLHRSDIRRWALGEGEARFYTKDLKFIWRFRADQSQLEVLRKLTEPFGRPRTIVRRGSRRKRAIAASLALAGAVTTPLAVHSGPDFYMLGFVAILVTAFAFGSFVDASRRVLYSEPGVIDPL